MKKKFIIHMIAAIFYMGGCVWGAIEGIDYFVNENSVNWMFLLPLAGGLSVAMINIVSMFNDK